MTIKSTKGKRGGRHTPRKVQDNPGQRPPRDREVCQLEGDEDDEELAS
jgi:hypothetical protein